jgi:adenosylcobyric acid synthase
MTTFNAVKQTRRVVARVNGDSALWSARDADDALNGYEIHMGRTEVIPDAKVGPVPFVAEYGGAQTADGCCSADGLIVGTYVHGLLENVSLRRALLTRLAARKAMALPIATDLVTFETAVDHLADVVRDSLDCAAISRIVGLPIDGATA